MANKTASAIGYSAQDIAPKLLASGKGRTAEHIVAIAKESGIAIIENSALATLLDSSASPGEIIPVWCWESAAKILALVRKLEYE